MDLNGVRAADCQHPLTRRGALYVDGFNLYHPIAGCGLPYLKWTSMWRLGEILCRSEELEMVKAVVCTAMPKHMPEKMGRHNKYVASQIATGTAVIKGHYVPDGVTYSEKQTDINLALAVILDGIDDLYDTAFLLTADSDQVATAKAFKVRLAPLGKRLIGAIPFGRPGPTDYEGLGVKSVSVSIDMLEKCVMPDPVHGVSGHLIYRPAEYAPPTEWFHPDNRPEGRPKKSKGKWGPAYRA